MKPLRRLPPRGLFARTVLTLVLTFGLFAVLILGSVVYYALMPVAQRSADDLVSFMLLSAQSWVMLPANLRPAYADRVMEEHKIWIRETDGPIEDSDYFLPYVRRVEAAMEQRVGFATPVRSQVLDGRRWFFIDLKMGNVELRLGFPRDRIATRPLTGLLFVALFSLFLVLVTAAVLARGITTPLTRLSHAARQVAQGSSPEPLPERGPKELASLARQFNYMTRQVQELLGNRTTLLSGISHDLRTPITRLRLALEMLPPRTDPSLVKRMERDLEQMSELIGEALALAKGLGTKEREEVDINALVQELVDGRPRLNWRVSGVCRRRVNSTALRRILGNLVDNALRYSGEAPVDLEVDCAEEQTLIKILDRGPGIPDEQKDAVFRPFYRLEQSRSRETGGTGLGLAIVRHLVDGNALDVQLKDRSGGGTEAIVILRNIDDESGQSGPTDN